MFLVHMTQRHTQNQSAMLPGHLTPAPCPQVHISLRLSLADYPLKHILLTNSTLRNMAMPCRAPNPVQS